MSHHIAQRPRDIATCVNAYLQEDDLDGIASLFHPDCQVFFSPDQPPLLGHDGVRQAFEGFSDIKATIRSDVFCEVIDGRFALVRANWSAVTAD